jgi:ligand-binding sensor domain-containing protein
MKELGLFIVCYIFSAWYTHAQTARFNHYDVRDGLAGSTVYRMCQDKNGFLWFGTNSGLSRFDGNKFTNFTVADGLPDNEIICVFADSKGRVWIAPFKQAICYYYNGKLYTKDNDPLLKKVNLKGIVIHVYEDSLGNIILKSDGSSIRISPNDEVQTVTSNEFMKYFNTACSYPYPIRDVDNVHREHFKVVSNYDSVIVYWCKSPRPKVFKLGRRLMSYNVLNDSTLYLNTNNGVCRYNANTESLDYPMLIGNRISQTVKDDEGNIWFVTMENGVYQNNLTNYANSITIKDILGYDYGAYCFNTFNNYLNIGNEVSLMLSIDRKTKNIVRLKRLPFLARLSENQTLFFKQKAEDRVLLAGNASLIEISLEGKLIHEPLTVIAKDAIEYDADRILIATATGVILFNHNTWATEKEFWNKRATSVAFKDDSVFIGTLDGLFVWFDGRCTSLGQVHPALQRRISKMFPAADGSVWIATYDYGLIQWKDNKVISHLTVADGLSSNICRTLTGDEQAIWVGTDKGLNKIVWQNNSYTIDIFNTYHGLNSNYINAILIDGDFIYVGTPIGYTYFNQRELTSASKSRLVFMGVNTRSEFMPPDSVYSFAYPDHENLIFNFAGISHSSGGTMRYRYRLDGFETEWRETQQNSLEYVALPFGNYELNIIAINALGKESNQVRVKFEIIPPYWQTWWFQSLMVVAVIVIISGLIYARFRKLRLRTLEENRIAHQLMELEQRALKAQMNPHFIFNCLNAIQQFILVKDIEQSNKHLTTLARMIRQTLDVNSKHSISLREELNYLSNYLSLEQMRFSEEFDYKINFDSDALYLQYQIPSMILQPYIENCIRHGLRYKKSGKGWLTIDVKETKGILTFVIEDNGVGRRKAHELKSKQHIEYQSKGTSVTKERIDLINKNYATRAKASVIIHDLNDDSGVSLGTRVIIQFPIEILHKLSTTNVQSPSLN